MKSKSQNILTEKSKSEKKIFAKVRKHQKGLEKAKRQVRPLHEYRKANLKENCNAKTSLFHMKERSKCLKRYIYHWNPSDCSRVIKLFSQVNESPYIRNF